MMPVTVSGSSRLLSRSDFPSAEFATASCATLSRALLSN